MIIGTLTFYIAVAGGFQEPTGNEANAVEREISQLKVELGSDTVEFARALNELGHSFYQQGSFEMAGAMYLKSLRIYEKVLGGNSQDVGVSLDCLAMVKKAQGLLPEAQSLFKRSLSIKKGGGQWISVANTSRDLAEVLNSQGLHAEALPYLRESLEKFEYKLGKEDPAVLDARGRLAKGLLEESVNNSAEAGQILERLISGYEESLGHEDPTVGYYLGLAGQSDLMLGRAEEAIPKIRRALAIYKRSSQSVPIYKGNLLNLLGRALCDGGFPAEARLLHMQSLAIFENEEGLGRILTANTLSLLALACSNLGLGKESIVHARQAKNINQKFLGSDHLGTAISMHDLAVFLDRHEGFEESLPLHEKALTVCERELKEDDPFLGTVLLNFGHHFLAQSKHEKSLPLLQRGLNIQERSYGALHPQVGTAYGSLALVMQGMGFFYESRTLLDRAIRVIEETVGPDHLLMANPVKQIAGLLEFQGRLAAAPKYYKKSLRLQLGYMSRNLSSLSEAERFRMLETQDGSEDLLLNLSKMTPDGLLAELARAQVEEDLDCRISAVLGWMRDPERFGTNERWEKISLVKSQIIEMFPTLFVKEAERVGEVAGQVQAALRVSTLRRRWVGVIQLFSFSSGKDAESFSVLLEKELRAGVASNIADREVTSNYQFLSPGDRLGETVVQAFAGLYSSHDKKSPDLASGHMFSILLFAQSKNRVATCIWLTQSPSLAKKFLGQAGIEASICDIALQVDTPSRVSDDGFYKPLWQKIR